MMVRYQANYGALAVHRPNAQATLELVRFGTDGKTEKRYLEMFRARHVRAERHISGALI